MNPDAHVVHSLWALACETLWTKVDESQFALPKMPRSWVGTPSTFPDYDIFVPLAETHSASPYTSDLDQSGSDPDENPPAKRFKHAETPSIPIVEWEGSGPWSNGAEVWSPHRRTLLLYQEQRRGPSERPAIVEPRLAQVST
ncbi:MAG: hypothetical protein KVP17_003407 [Porospora cf. gigantea B]|uniref:uncharacterized protein n=1 Tax=Porospora cf. gigantea B TaxID=2853592 RepID=UPI003571D615|nr:MAG: hypothetical protein KVP17_003407 [Porospora cf. gigantea B]